ncbi:MAG: GGDEF domain-containing protein [Polyangiaceae bacterium]|nr:GGDEF domain-containing protein [Polyangiaceae bacterium]
MANEVWSSRWRALPRSRAYPLIGAVLAFGAPGGLLALHALRDGALPAPAWIAAELAAHAGDYAYVTASTLAVLVWLGWRLGRKDDSLRDGALRDALTGLWNRRYLAQRLEHELSRARRQGVPLALLLVDVDHLKLINDRGGHALGDAALDRVAAALRATCRVADVPARYGGDELAVLVPGTPAASAAALAERIRAAVDGSLGGDHRMSVSIGVAGVPPGARESAPRAEALCAAADRALYEAKAAGRNRVVVAPDAEVDAARSGSPARDGAGGAGRGGAAAR